MYEDRWYVLTYTVPADPFDEPYWETPTGCFDSRIAAEREYDRLTEWYKPEHIKIVFEV